MAAHGRHLTGPACVRLGAPRAPHPPSPYPAAPRRGPRPRRRPAPVGRTLLRRPRPIVSHSRARPRSQCACARSFDPRLLSPLSTLTPRYPARDAVLDRPHLARPDLVGAAQGGAVGERGQRLEAFHRAVDRGRGGGAVALAGVEPGDQDVGRVGGQAKGVERVRYLREEKGDRDRRRPRPPPPPPHLPLSLHTHCGPHSTPARAPRARTGCGGARGGPPRELQTRRGAVWPPTRPGPR